MAVKLINITNVSPQLVRILYGVGKTGNDASGLPLTEAGELPIPPGGKVEIEANRVDAGQIESLKRKNLITTVVR